MPKELFYKLPGEKRGRLIELSKELFVKEPIQNIGTREMIAHLQISTGSFYKYFDDIKDLYFYILSLFMDRLAERSKQTGLQMDIILPKTRVHATQVFQDIHNDPEFQAIFIKNFGLAPAEVKMEWFFKYLIYKRKYIELYDSTIFQSVDKKVRDNRELIMYLFLALPTVIEAFAPMSLTGEYAELYRFCSDILRIGMLCYNDENIMLGLEKEIFVSMKAADAGNINEIAAVYVQCLQKTYEGCISKEYLNCITKETCIETLQKNYTYGAYIGPICVGTVVFCSGQKTDQSAPSGEILAIYCQKDYWGAGVGRQMLEFAIGELKTLGCDNVFLWSFTENGRADAFYKKNGFTIDTAGEKTINFGRDLSAVRYFRSL